MPTAVTDNEVRLLGLCRRLLAHNEELHAETEHLRGKLRWLCREYRSLRESAEREEAGRDIESAAADIFLGSAIDELLRSRNQPEPQP